MRWLHVLQPSDTDLGRALPEVLAGTRINEEAASRLVTAAGSGVRRPMLRSHAGTTALSLRLLEYDDARDAVESGEQWLLVNGPDVVTVVRRPDVVAEPSTGPAVAEGEQMSEEGSAVDVLHHVLLEAVAGYEDVVSELEVDVDEVELSVFSQGRSRDAERIYLLKREVSEARRAILPLGELLDRRVREDAVLGAWFSHAGSVDVVERLHRAGEVVETLDALLSSILEAHVARVSVQQNEDMRRISAGAALIVAPTFLAGLWGMNFTHMPELDWTYGYPMALGLMALCVGALWRAFRRSGWL